MTRQGEAGLTLPEMLVSVAILAAIMAAVAPSLRGTTRATLALQSSATDAEELRQGHDILQRLADTAIWGEPSVPALHNDGVSDRYRFGTYDPQGYPAIARLETHVGGGLSLSLARLEAPETVIHESLLFPSMSDISIRYFGSVDERNPPAWHQSWRRAKPPQLVRVSGVAADQGQSREITFDIAMAGQAPLVCEFDPVSRLCRNVE